MITQTYQIEQAGQVAVATVSAGEVTALLMQELTAELMVRMRNDNALHFVLDLKGVQFMSSSCLGVLVAFLQDLEHVRGRVALAHCNPNIAFLFKVTRLDAVFALYDEVEEAKAKVAKG